MRHCRIPVLSAITFCIAISTGCSEDSPIIDLDVSDMRIEDDMVIPTDVADVRVDVSPEDVSADIPEDIGEVDQDVGADAESDVAENPDPLGECPTFVAGVSRGYITSAARVCSNRWRHR